VKTGDEHSQRDDRRGDVGPAYTQLRQYVPQKEQPAGRKKERCLKGCHQTDE